MHLDPSWKDFPLFSGLYGCALNIALKYAELHSAQMMTFKSVSPDCARNLAGISGIRWGLRISAVTSLNSDTEQTMPLSLTSSLGGGNIRKINYCPQVSAYAAWAVLRVQRICSARAVCRQSHDVERLRRYPVPKNRHLVPFETPQSIWDVAWGWLVWHRTCRKSPSCRSVVGSCEKYPSASQMALFQQWDPSPMFLKSQVTFLSSYSSVNPPHNVASWLCRQSLQRKAGEQSQSWMLSWVNLGIAPSWIVSTE